MLWRALNGSVLVVSAGSPLTIGYFRCILYVMRLNLHMHAVSLVAYTFISVLHTGSEWLSPPIVSLNRQISLSEQNTNVISDFSNDPIGYRETTLLN